MGKGTDKLYITHSEWASDDAFGASVGSNVRRQRPGASSNRLLFNFCAASLQPFRNPVCTSDGTIFDAEVIAAWLEKHQTNPVTGRPLTSKDLIRLVFARNADAPAHGTGDLIDPVTFKVLTENSHIVAVRHGSYANVFAWDTVERMNIKAKMWRDLVDDVEFGRKDIITLQDPQQAVSRCLGQSGHVKKGEEQEEEEGKAGKVSVNVNVPSLGPIGDKVLRAKEAVERARQSRWAGGDVNRSSKRLQKPDPAAAVVSRTRAIEVSKLAYKTATYTTGRAAASFTSTGLTPETSNERAVLTDEEWMLKPKRIKIKGYARLETNLGPLKVELQTETAPKAVWNFVKLSQKGYYKGVAFHRNIKNFMIQGGDPTGTGRGGSSIWGRNFEDELDGPLRHDGRGLVSMANKGRNTNSSQFFITYRPAKHLDRKHTIFGRIVGGEDVLERMEQVPTSDDNRPLQDVVIQDVVVYLDPFAEYVRERKEREEAEAREAELRHPGGTEDDRTTWTGRRIRDDGLVEDEEPKGVGRYLNAALAQQQQLEHPEHAAALDAWEEAEPVRKKARTRGFGNFDNW